MEDKSSEDYNPFQYVIKNRPEDIEKIVQLEGEELLTEDERAASLDIMARYKAKVADLEIFLKKEYMVFDNKINRCLLTHCYDNIYQPRENVRDCVQTCTQGFKNADTFVTQRIDEFTKNFAECIEKAQNYKKNIMQETFQCYDKMLNTFEKIKKEVNKEFSYYE